MDEMIDPIEEPFDELVDAAVLVFVMGALLAALMIAAKGAAAVLGTTSGADTAAGVVTAGVDAAATAVGVDTGVLLVGGALLTAVDVAALFCDCAGVERSEPSRSPLRPRRPILPSDASRPPPRLLPREAFDLPADVVFVSETLLVVLRFAVREAPREFRADRFA